MCTLLLRRALPVTFSFHARFQCWFLRTSIFPFILLIDLLLLLLLNTFPTRAVAFHILSASLSPLFWCRVFIDFSDIQSAIKQNCIIIYDTAVVVGGGRRRRRHVRFYFYLMSWKLRVCLARAVPQARYKKNGSVN